MKLVHTGLVSSTGANAERFYGKLLGLVLTRRSELSAQLAAELFGIDRGCELLYYGESPLLFEVFVTGWSEPVEKRISHVCIETAGRNELLRRCGEMGFPVREATKGNQRVVFIEDNDGNLFEVKETG